MPGGSPSRCKPRDERTRVRDRDRRTAQAGGRRRLPGMTVYFQPVQDIQIARAEPRAVPVHAGRHRRGRGADLGSDRLVASSCGAIAAAARRRLGGAGGGLRAADQRRPREGRPARHLDADRQRHAQRCLRPAADLDHLRAGQPVPRDPRGRAAISARSVGAAEDLRAGEHRRASRFRPRARSNTQQLSTCVHGARARRCRSASSPASSRTTAPLAIAHQEQFPAVTISFNLAPGASLGDAVDVIAAAEREIGMPTSIIGSYSGDAAEFARSLAGEPWLILAAVDHDLHRARRALRELHPSADDPVDAALGRRRRAAGADAVRPGPVDRRADRHRAADGHRQEERHHDDRLRARGGARAAACRRAMPSCRPACCASARS